MLIMDSKPAVVLKVYSKLLHVQSFTWFATLSVVYMNCQKNRALKKKNKVFPSLEDHE